MNLNFVAVGAAAVAVFFLSTGWYMALGRQLAAARGEASTDADQAPPAGLVLLELFRSAIVATALAALTGLLGIRDVAGAVALAVGLWVAFPVVLLAGSIMWEKVPARLGAIHAGDWLVKLAAIAIIVSVWR